MIAGRAVPMHAGRRGRRVRGLALLLAIGGLAGCRPGSAKVEGEVALGGAGQVHPAALGDSGSRHVAPPRRDTLERGPDTLRQRGPDTLRQRGPDSLRLRQPGELRTVLAEPAEGWTGPDALPFEVTVRTREPAAALSRKFGTITLRTSLRSRAADVGQYPCTSCHQGRRVVLADERVKDAHRNIEPVHPKQTGATCATCHAAENVELLTLRSGERASLDHTYRLCAQCHFQQARAWAGGGHGKRLDGWQGRRVVMGCADCHDPHRPALEPRLPFRGPVLERPRSPIP